MPRRKEFFSLNLPPEQIERLRRLKKKSRVSMARHVEAAIDAYLEHVERDVAEDPTTFGRRFEERPPENTYEEVPDR